MSYNLSNLNSDLFNTEDQESFYSIKPEESIFKINEDMLTEALQSELKEKTANFASSDFNETLISTTPGVCRICLQPDLDESNKCITPCFCRGSISKVHRKCLETWLSQAETDDCEICKFKYNTMRITKYSLLGSIKSWLLGNESIAEVKELMFDGMILLPIALVMLFLTYSGFYITNQIFDNEISIYYDATYRIMSFCACTTIMCADFLFGIWTTYRVQYHISHWFSFYKRSQQVIIIDQKIQENNFQENYVN